MDCTRYAIWWVPRPGTALARFGAEWSGWCADRGVRHARRALSVLSRPRAGVPGAMRLRGLHATIRSPFRLAAGRSAWALDDALVDLASRTAPIRLPRLRLAIDDGRVVLEPMRPAGPMAGLITAVAEAVLPFEVAPSYAALAGVRAGSGAPVGAIAAGGFVVPDVPERAVTQSVERFRLPLTDRLDAAVAGQIVAELKPFLETLLSGHETLADIALVGDPGRGRPWRLLDRFALEGGEGMRSDPRLPAGMDCRGPSLMAPFGGGRAVA